MTQKNKYSPIKGTQPQRFMPRRDLFPDNNGTLSTPNKSHYDTKASRNTVAQNPISNLSFSPLTLLAIVIGWYILSSWFKKSEKGVTFDIKSTVNDALNNPQTLDILKAVGPYLEDREQDVIYTTAGIMEVIHTVKDLLDHRYQDRQKSMILSVPLDPAAKKIEMLKVIKPYMPESNRYTLDNVVSSYEAIDKLSRNIEIYKNNRVLSDNKKMKALETINEIVKVVRPIIPIEHLEKVDKVMQIIHVFEALDLTNNMGNSNNMDKKSGTASKKTTPTNNKSEERTEQMITSLKSMLNDEQKESVDVIMKMAQLLAQPTEEEQT